ncbi:host-nuclease inhibitor Gam family protein [Virgibacillus sp. YIM 98842]|jgi:AAA15 family ATPase/GTPase|uniref:host-nuclease inhibitor Gam family protein n=1 Tax=Virgibacillus sp. YIM 98842 TaxID=2663533 RepID=UPI0013DC6D80|nr:host-nuclease inhibitor Gam family protein [Virgibacillus sp. YIM 98842]
MNKQAAVTAEDLERYYTLRKQKTEMEKEINELKKKIHDYFDNHVGEKQKGSVTLGDYQASRQIRSSVHYDREETVEKLEKLNLKDFIIVEEKPDTEKLEAAIKVGLVEKDAFADCKNTKLTQAIVVKEV